MDQTMSVQEIRKTMNPDDYIEKNFVISKEPINQSTDTYMDLINCPSTIPELYVNKVNPEFKVQTHENLEEIEDLIVMNPRDFPCRPRRQTQIARLFYPKNYFEQLKARCKSLDELRKATQMYLTQ